MAKKKTPEIEAKKANRKGESLTVWVDSQVVIALEKFIAQSHPKVTRRSTVEAALQDFLAAKGFWPPHDAAAD